MSKNKIKTIGKKFPKFFAVMILMIVGFLLLMGVCATVGFILGEVLLYLGAPEVVATVASAIVMTAGTISIGILVLEELFE